jgi:hypothetical protein
MPRQPRLDAPGALQHVMARGIEKTKIFSDEKDNGFFVKSFVCEEDPYFLELVRYIHLNPLRSGLVKDLEELNVYPWCGFGVLMGRDKKSWQEIDEVLKYFANRVGQARSGYRRFMEDGIK